MSINIFEGMSKKDKKEFQKMPNEQKASIIQVALLEKVSGVMNTEITKAIITGSEIEKERIYKKYVSKIDSFEENSEEYKNSIEKLLSYLRLEHLKYIKKHETRN